MRPHQGFNPNRHDIEDPVSIGKADTEEDAAGANEVVIEPPGTGADVAEVPVKILGLEGVDWDDVDSVWESSDTETDAETADPEETWTRLVVTVFTKIVTKVESLCEIVLVAEEVNVRKELSCDIEDIDWVERLSSEEAELRVTIPDDDSGIIDDETSVLLRICEVADEGIESEVLFSVVESSEEAALKLIVLFKESVLVVAMGLAEPVPVGTLLKVISVESSLLLSPLIVVLRAVDAEVDIEVSELCVARLWLDEVMGIVPSEVSTVLGRAEDSLFVLLPSELLPLLEEDVPVDAEVEEEIVELSIDGLDGNAVPVAEFVFSEDTVFEPNVVAIIEALEAAVAFQSVRPVAVALPFCPPCCPDSRDTPPGADGW